MSILDFLNGGSLTVTDDIKKLSDAQLVNIMKKNPYRWSIAKMAVVAQEIKNRGIIIGK